MKKIALITGARGGIGSAITTALLTQGYRIIATHSSVNAAAAREWYQEQGYQPDRGRVVVRRLKRPRRTPSNSRVTSVPTLLQLVPG